MPRSRLIAAASFVVALAACHNKADDAAATAVAQVESGTVSDAMLPIDRVTSQPPLAPEAAVAAADSSTTGKPGAKPKAMASAAAADSEADAESDATPVDSGD